MTFISNCDLQTCETGIRGGGTRRGGVPGDEDDEKRRKSPFTPCCELLNKFSTFEKYPSIE